jgi:hypothetical protein
MSLRPDPIQPVPEETARVARAAFRKGNPLLELRDELGTIFSDEGFADLFPRLGQPGLPSWPELPQKRLGRERELEPPPPKWSTLR